MGISRFLYHFLFIRVNPKIHRKRINRKRSRKRENLRLHYSLFTLFVALRLKLCDVRDENFAI